MTNGKLTMATADMMIENCIGVLPVPMGLGLNFVINGKKCVIPMAIEEPSVIAAASSSAKFICERCEGFKVFTTEPVMAAQIQIIGVDYTNVKFTLDANKEEIIKYANGHCLNMVKRGGGCKGIRHRKLYEIDSDHERKDVIVVELLINVQEVMGMNICNTVAEATSGYIRELIGDCKIGLRITSNLCLERMAYAFFKIPVTKLAWKDSSGEKVAEEIISAYNFAENDKFRAVTHNKGIMNGIDAVAVALGQDWRAIESAAHAYASLNGDYKPLTKYRIAKDDSGKQHLIGTFQIPLACASLGGAIGTNPSYSISRMIADNPSSKETAGMLVSVGLAQNFAAIRALAIEGIQKGHMNLHAKNVAINAGVPQNLITEVVSYMQSKGRINVGTAQEYMRAHDIYKSVNRKTLGPVSNSNDFSSFYIRIDEKTLSEPMILNLIFETPNGCDPMHLSIEKENPDDGLTKEIFGTHTYSWIAKFMVLLEELQPVLKTSQLGSSTTRQTRSRLKLLIILINAVVTTILKKNGAKGIEIIEYIHSICMGNEVEYTIPSNQFFVHNLLIELIATFKHYIDANVQNVHLKELMIKDVMEILFGLKESYRMKTAGIKLSEYPAYIDCRRKRLNIVQVMLIDTLSIREISAK